MFFQKIIVSFFLTIFIYSLNANEIVKDNAKQIAESSKVFILNFAIDELNKKINADMKKDFIKAVDIYDHYLKKSILSTYKDKNSLLVHNNIPKYIKNYPKIAIDIIEDKTYDRSILATLTLYYDPNFLPNQKTKSVYFTKEEKEYLESKKTIKTCIDPHALPFEALNKNGKYIGITSDILKLAQKKSNIKLEIIRTKNWSQSLEYIKQKKCDILSLAMKTKKRSEYLNFTKPYLNFPLVVLTNYKEIFIDNISELYDKKISIIKGYAHLETFKENFPRIKILEVKNMKEGINSVKKGKVFAHIDVLASVVYTLQKEGITDVKIAGKLNHQLPLSIAIRNDEPILQSIMQKAISSVSIEDMRSIQNRWLAIKFEQKIDFTLFYEVFLVFTIIFLIALWRYLEVKKINKLIIKKNKELNEAYKKMSLLASTDRLTKLNNRHKLEEVLSFNKDLCNRYDNSFGVILIDVDFFKQINDNYGHIVGDNTLKSIAKVLLSTSRKTDTIGRWGGEEFLIVVPNTTKKSILAFAENIRETIEKTDFEDVKKVTISAGISIYKNQESSENLISRCDKALYMSKKHGRNQVTYL